MNDDELKDFFVVLDNASLSELAVIVDYVNSRMTGIVQDEANRIVLVLNNKK